MPYLLIRKGANQGVRIPLTAGTTVLGREKDCDIVLVPTDATRGKQKDAVSRKHAIIARHLDDYYLEDGNGRGKPSHNGTALNDAPVAFPGRVKLKNGDVIKICDFLFAFYDVTPDPDSSARIETARDHDSSLYLTQPAEKLKLLLEITNRLSNILELDTLLPQVVEQLLQIFKQADRGFLIMVDAATGELVRRGFKARSQEDEAHGGFSSSIVKQCLDTRKGLISNDVPAEFPNVHSVAGLALRSVMCAPLCLREGKTFGVLQLDSHDPRRYFTEEDLNLLMGVATQASIALMNAQYHREALERERHKRDLALAREVVKNFLPERLPEIPGYEFYARCESAQEVGGDYYDLVPLSGNQLAILVGDVAGKGVAAALVMARFSAEARSCLQTGTPLAAAVRRLNTLMQPLSFTDRFVTLAALLLDPAAHTVTLVNAGHPLPLLLRRATGGVEEAIPRDIVGPPLGVIEDCDYPAHQLTLHPGDSMVLFSDGVPDAMDVNEDPFGTPRLHGVLEDAKVSPYKLGERVLGAVAKHAAGRSQHDDITLVCFGRL